MKIGAYLLGVIQGLVQMRVLQFLLKVMKRMLQGLLHAVAGVVLPMRRGDLLGHGGFSGQLLYIGRLSSDLTTSIRKGYRTGTTGA